jgi:hypothetical protein
MSYDKSIEDELNYYHDQQLTKSDCEHIFCKLFTYSRSSYYRQHEKDIKLKPKYVTYDENGNRIERCKRITFNILLGAIHIIIDSYDPEVDPPYDEITPYLTNVPA